MSRSQPTDLKNPSKKFFTWKGSTGEIVYFDKETKENINVPLPFHFLVLDKLITIVGFSDADESGIWGNEIRNTKTQILTVRTKHGTKKTGFYEDVKTVPGAKFAQSLYLAFYDENKVLQIGNIKLSGCAVSAWIEFGKGRDVYQGALSITGKEEGKKGATKFFSPVFAQKDTVSDAAQDAAIALDKELQTYLTAYFAAVPVVPEATDDYIEQRNKEIETFDEPKAQAAAANSFGAAEHYTPEEIDDSSIPF